MNGLTSDIHSANERANVDVDVGVRVINENDGACVCAYYWPKKSTYEHCIRCDAKNDTILFFIFDCKMK